MNKPILSGLALLLAGCPKTQNAVETSSPQETPAPQLVAAYLIKNGLYNEGVYRLDFETDTGTPFSVGYYSDGVKGSFADDGLFLLVFNEPDNALCYDIGLDGTLDFVTDTNDATPLFPFTSLTAEQQLALSTNYMGFVSAFADYIRKNEDIKTLQKVQPQ